MPTEQDVAPSLPRRRRLLLRGESAVASAGIAIAAILLSVMGASAWWTAKSQRVTEMAARGEQLRAVGDLLSQSAEVLLANDELTSVRRLVLESSPAYRLGECRIILSDGSVIASTNPSQITAHSLPKTWNSSRLLDDTVSPGGQFFATYPITIAGRGKGELQITAPLDNPFWTYWEAQSGVGAIGAFALVGLLIVYRHMRRKLRAIGAIREALLALAAGENASPSLVVSTELGPEASSWNELITEKENLRRQQVSERAKEALGRRGEGHMDLSSACDAMSQGLILIDDKHCVSYANGAAAAFLRANRDELVGADIAKFLEVENVLAAIREIASGTVRRRTILDVERQDDSGNGVLRFNVRPVRREDSASAMVTIEDITQQRVAEEARNQFVAHATHELRTPLTNIRLYVETAIDEGEADPATRAKCLNVINSETRRLERIVGEMLSVAEIEAGSFKLKTDDVRLDTLFEELQADYQQQATDKRVELTFKLPPKLPAIQGDRDKVVLALHNLLGNALKYTPPGGRVTLTVELDAKQLVVMIEDTGIGIKPEDAERIFDRFYRAKDPRVSKITGTGLGLTLAREVVRLHGGDITVDSKIDQGSTFTMTLPVTTAVAA